MKMILTRYLLLAAACGLAGTVSCQAAPQDSDARTQLVACADEENPPFSSRAENGGIDVDVAQAIAQSLGRTLSLRWVLIPARGGLGKALRQTIQAGECDLFLGLPENVGADDELGGRPLVASPVYLTTGYLMVSAGKHVHNLQDAKNAHRVGAVTATPADLYLYKQNFHRVPYGNNPDLLRALHAGEVDAALVWAPAIARARGTPLAPGAGAILAEQPKDPELQTRFVIATPKQDEQLGRQVSDAIEKLAADGTLKAIAAKHGLPMAAH